MDQSTDEKKVEIAKLLGIVVTGVEDGVIYTLNTYDKSKGGLQPVYKPLPDFLNDRNTQPQMLAVMSWEQKKRLCELFCGEPLCEHDAIDMLGYCNDQPTFADLWLEVMRKG